MGFYRKSLVLLVLWIRKVQKARVRRIYRAKRPIERELSNMLVNRRRHAPTQESIGSLRPIFLDT